MTAQMPMNFVPFKNLTRSQYVFETIKNAIFSGQLTPGTMLRELKLAKQFDVSQSIIREAFFQLEQIGLATKIPHKGTSVTQLSDREIKERLQVRTCLEKVACHEAIKNMNTADYDQLYQLSKKITQAQLANLYYDASVADLNFHRYIWRKAMNEILFKTLDQIATPLFTLISVKRSIDAQKLEEVMYSHEEYIEALMTADTGKIDDTVFAHATRSYKQIGVKAD
ncbi:GntR family transcriptional regulator [candidate division KSB1 bacterium]|nr:GntR family transcriptional regulator [candidate division KSB1 bacterium]